MTPSRRSLLQGTAAGVAAASLPLHVGRALAASGSSLKFVFVVCYGGWDHTRVLATEFTNPGVDMEEDAWTTTLGDLAFVDHAARPSVRTFFERQASRSLIVNGVLSPSVAHENCLKLMLTGTTANGAADWPAILASGELGRVALPHLVIAGPSFAGDAGPVVTRTGSSGQLQGLLDGTILTWSDTPTGRPSGHAEARMDAYLAGRAAASAQAYQSQRVRQVQAVFADALGRSASLKDLLYVMDWDGGSSFESQASLASDALALGLSRCITLSYSGAGWDTHSNNDPTQSSNFEGLFSGLNSLMERLQAATGPSGGALADETVVVVMSEMGRTPQKNAGNGKDHWPYTGVLITGPGVTGGRVVGGYDRYFYGLRVDPDTGEAWDGGVDIASNALGATLLQLAGVDPELWLPGVSPLPGLLL